MGYQILEAILEQYADHGPDAPDILDGTRDLHIPLGCTKLRRMLDLAAN